MTRHHKEETCIVTGGVGFIGTAVAHGLTNRFERLIIVDNLHPQIHETPEPPAALPASVEFLRGDVTDARVWDAVLPGAKPTMILHLAAETGTGQSLTEASRHTHTNVCGTAVMLDALVRHAALPKRLILTSSRAVYGEGAWRSLDGAQLLHPGQRTREQLSQGQWDFPFATALHSCAATTRTSPVSIYGATKLAQEQLMASWACAFGTELTILRLQNVYGPGQSMINSYTGILTLFCQLARQGVSIPLYEDGEMRRDFVLIDDVAAAILLTVDQAKSPALPYDVGTGKAITLAAMARHLAAYYGAPAPHVCGKYRFGDVRHAACNIDAIQSELGWTPDAAPEQGLSALIAWIEQRAANGKHANTEASRGTQHEPEYADFAKSK